MYQSLLTQAQDSKQEGYKEKARQMLSEAFGTPKTERRSDAPNERTREETNTVARPSPVSSSSDKTADEEESPIAPPNPTGMAAEVNHPLCLTPERLNQLTQN